MTLARMRWWGLGGVIAGVVFLLGVPIYQSLVLLPAGFVAPNTADPASFGAFLAWAGAHAGADAGSRTVELIPFLLALGLPSSLRRILWAGEPRGGRAATLLAVAGLVVFAGVLAAGYVLVPRAAAAYDASTATHTASADSYARVYGFETVLTRLVADGLIGLSLLLISLRTRATHRLPVWFAYIGFVVAGLLGATALSALLGLGLAAAQAQQFALPGLALWFISAGVILLRIQVRARTAEPTASGVAPLPDSAD